jgi:hypothetical protein
MIKKFGTMGKALNLTSIKTAAKQPFLFFKVRE